MNERREHREIHRGSADRVKIDIQKETKRRCSLETTCMRGDSERCWGQNHIVKMQRVRKKRADEMTLPQRAESREKIVSCRLRLLIFSLSIRVCVCVPPDQERRGGLRLGCGGQLHQEERE